MLLNNSIVSIVFSWSSGLLNWIMYMFNLWTCGYYASSERRRYNSVCVAPGFPLIPIPSTCTISIRHRSMISAKNVLFHFSSSIGWPLGPTWSTAQIAVRFVLMRWSKILEFLAIKTQSGFITVGNLTLRGLKTLLAALVCCCSGLIDLTVREVA